MESDRSRGPTSPGDAPRREPPLVKFRRRPRRRVASTRMTLLVGGAALAVILYLLLKLF